MTLPLRWTERAGGGIGGSHREAVEQYVGLGRANVDGSLFAAFTDRILLKGPASERDRLNATPLPFAYHHVAGRASSRVAASVR